MHASFDMCLFKEEEKNIYSRLWPSPDKCGLPKQSSQGPRIKQKIQGQFLWIRANVQSEPSVRRQKT